MATPYILELLANLKDKVATNETNISKNAEDIKKNRQDFDTHTADNTRHWTTADRTNFNRVIHFKGYYASIDALKKAYPTGTLGDYAIVGETDTVWVWDDTSKSWLNSTEQGIVISVNGRTGEVVLSKSDVGLGNVDNTSDKNKPISIAQQKALDAKADRKIITLAQANSTDHSLLSGIYRISNESTTILGTTSAYWSVIVETDSSMIGSQIWIPIASTGNTEASNTGKIFFRKEYNGSDNARHWGAFLQLATNTDISGLQSQITTNKNNITSNDTDITNLQNDKADRKKIKLSEANSLTLKSGIYTIENEAYDILGCKSNYWTVISIYYQEDHSGANQIWFPFQTSEQTSSAQSNTKMFFRKQYGDGSGTKLWSDFVEVRTSKDITDINIININHFKGYYETAAALNDAQKTGKAGDYAVIGENECIYIWNVKQSAWTSVINEESVGTGIVTSVNGMVGAVTVTKSSVGLANVDNTADTNKNVNSAKTLTTGRKIDGVTFNGSADIVHYGTCNTAAGTAAKVVACTNYTLATGSRIIVKFTVANTAASPTLNVNSTGAHAIQSGGVAITPQTLKANSIYEFVYDGTNYQLVGGTIADSDIYEKTVTFSTGITTSWMDVTGVTSSFMPSGAYVVLAGANWAGKGNIWDERWTGVFSWFSSGTNSTNAEEILLHNAGHADNANELYLRTVRVNAGSLKLQVALKTVVTDSVDINFKFRKLI